MATQVTIYEGTTRVAVLECDNASDVWRHARAAVRRWAKLAGDTSNARWEQPRGRFSYSMGPFHASSSYRRDLQEQRATSHRAGRHNRFASDGCPLCLGSSFEGGSK